MVCHGKAPHILLWARVPWGIIWCSEQHKYKYTQTKIQDMLSGAEVGAANNTHTQTQIQKYSYKDDAGNNTYTPLQGLFPSGCF